VPSDTFFDPRYAPVSGIWALDIDENVLFGHPRPSVLVRNHAATNPIPASLLPVMREYLAELGDDDYSVNWKDGRLACK
jgi:hypothetical protein